MNDKQEFYNKWIYPSYDDVIKKISEEREKFVYFEKDYDKKKKVLLEEYNQEGFIYLINLKRDYFTDLVKRIIKFFPQFDNIPYIVFYHGSYGRGISRYGSDMDLNILFDNEFIDVMKPIDELICAMIYQIVGFKGRDKIHNIMVNVPPLKKIKYNFDNGNHYKVIFLDGQVLDYYSRNYFEGDMTKIQNAPNSFEDFRKYILKHCNSHECYEWAYSFRYITSNYPAYDLNEVVKDADNKIKKVKNIHLKTVELIDKMIKDIQEYSFDFDEILISKLNKECKVRMLGFMYNSLALIRRCLVINGFDMGVFDIPKLLESRALKKYINQDVIDKLKDTLYYYNWNLARLEEFMADNGYNFSSREPSSISKKVLDEGYQKMYGTDFYLLQKDAVLQVKEILLIILNKFRDEEMKHV